jgi:hypothetical protein
MRFILLLFLVSFSIPCISQNNELLRSRGTLPGSIVGTAQQQTAYEIQKRKSRNEIITGDEFVLINSTANLCQRIAKSGRLMINDTLSSYANSVLDIILKDDPELRKKLCVYFYYSAGTNAITLDNGMIIVELGLMAHIENEAQLAFVLSHEVCHYRENHFLKYFQYSKSKKNDEGDPLASMLGYSRSLEEEADSMGFQIYKKAGYPLSESVTAFDMLKNSDMPEEQLVFEASFFEHGLYKFPAEYSLDTIYPVEKDEVDESLSTHPSCDKRMDHMQTLLGESDPYGNYFIVCGSLQAFNALRMLAREECCTLYLEERDYGTAIYSAYVLLKQDSTNAVAQKTIGKALYNLSAYMIPSVTSVVPKIFIVDYDEDQDFNFGRSEDDFEPLTKYDKVEGEGQKVNYLLSQMDSKEIAILALQWNWNMYSAGNYKDNVLSRMCNNLFFMLAVYHDTKLDDFNEDIRKNSEDSVEVEKLSESEKLKADLKKLKNIDNIDKLSDSDLEALLKKNDKEEDDERSYETDKSYCYRAFDEIKSETIFISDYREQSHRRKLEDPENVWSTSEKERRSSSGLGIKNMYILPPAYYRLKEIKRSHRYSYDPADSKALQQQQQAAITSTAKAVQRGFFMITPQTMDSTRVADYNTYCMLQQWLNEETSHASNCLALNLSHAELADSLATRLGTQYVMVSSIVCEKQKRVRNVAGFVVACLIPYSLPIAIIYGLTPRNRSQMESFVYDLKTGELVLVYEDYTKTKAGPTHMAGYYSKVLHKIAHKK